MNDEAYLFGKFVEFCPRCEGTGKVWESCIELVARGEAKVKCLRGCEPNACPSCHSGLLGEGSWVLFMYNGRLLVSRRK